jgi:hypothetical protein
MSASDNLSQELFFTVHRGLPAEKERLNQTRHVGMHWSANDIIAEDFAVDNNEPGRTKPYVIHAKVPISSVETDSDTLYNRSVGGDFSGEQEVPVKSGSPIQITGRTTLRKGKNDSRYQYSKSRKRTYNPPREATA